MEPKDFRQRRPDGNGKWIWNLKGIQPVLYRLPEVISHDEVILVEGEKDCDAVAGLGFIATTCPMGAKKWREHYNESLKGKHVVLIPDNDNEGREHMAQVGASLNGIAASLKWIDLPDLPSKGDVSDWLVKFTDKETAAERLAVMVDQAGEYTPPKQASIEDVVLEARDFTSLEIPEKKSILSPWLNEQSISLISGWRNVGKTHFALGLLDAVAQKKPFGPWKVGISVPCLYLDGEMPAQDVIERLNGLNPTQRRINPLYVYSDHYANSLALPRANLLSETWRTKMKSILITKGIKLWIADNLASLARGIDENVKRDWDPINSWLLDLRFSGIATIMLHHTGKEGSQRGTSAREDNIDVSMILKRPHDYVAEDGARFISHFTKTRVKTSELQLVADTQFQLSEDRDGRFRWTWSNVKGHIRVEVLRMLDEGHKYEAITDALGISKGRVSQIKSSAINEDLLTTKGKLTPSGFRLVHGGEKLNFD
jgi:putative DNA primase/helicase